MAVDNRSNLLEQALRLFAAHGYDAVGVQEIVEAAGVTKPTLYHYFGSKEGLLATLLAEHFEPLIDSVTEITSAYHGDLPQTLTRLVSAYFEYAKRHATFYRMQLSMVFAPPDSEPARAVRHFNEAQIRLLEAMFIRAVVDHGNMRGRHQPYAVTLRGMIDTYIGLFLSGYIELDDELLYRAVHQFMHGIYS